MKKNMKSSNLQKFEKLSLIVNIIVNIIILFFFEELANSANRFDKLVNSLESITEAYSEETILVYKRFHQDTWKNVASTRC